MEIISADQVESIHQASLKILRDIGLRVESDTALKFLTDVTAEGDKETVRRHERQLERAAQFTGGDPYALQSWHTGINPGTFIEGNPFENLEYWGTVAYGSPRYTHIHGTGLDRVMLPTI